MSTKRKCQECGWCGEQAEMLSAPHPFTAGEVLYGCPVCQEVADIVTACDEPGCMDSATCGAPTPEGYRVTCGDHWPGRRDA